jgi:hypothetical protein
MQQNFATQSTAKRRVRELESLEQELWSRVHEKQKQHKAEIGKFRNMAGFYPSKRMVL